MGQLRVSVTVPARLHLGFLDLEGGLGRRFGSLGLTLEGPYTRLHASRAASRAAYLAVEGPDGQRARDYVERLCRQQGIEPAVQLRIESAIPSHSGLGSGTQMALAAGTAALRVLGAEVPPRRIARLLDRGARSGIGLGAFEQGGVLLDGGRGEARGEARGGGGQPPPIVCRHPFPEAWRVLLIYDRQQSGLSGGDEVAAFAALPRFPAEQAGHLCRLMLMVAIPALIEQDLARFGPAVDELQAAIGGHFAPVQGGRFASPAVTNVLEWLAAQGLRGLGQSSWGPTGFALLGSVGEAERVLAAARTRWPQSTGLRFELRRGRNSGASIEASAAVPAALGNP